LALVGHSILFAHGKKSSHQRERSAYPISSYAHVLFAAACGELDQNAIALRLQPNEGIYLRFNGKVPGTTLGVRPVRMNFSYDSEFGAYTPEAYERLLLEAMLGDATLFIRRDEVETAWQIVDSVVEDGKANPFQTGNFTLPEPGGRWPRTICWRKAATSGMSRRWGSSILRNAK